MDRALCRAQPWGSGVSPGGKRRGGRAALPPVPGVPALLPVGASAGAGDSCGCCVTLGSLSSPAVPSAGDPGANPSVRGFFPSFSHCHSALCCFGALAVCPAMAEQGLSPASSKALSPVLPSVCDQTSDSLSPPSPSGQAGCNFHEILLGRAVPGLSLGSMCQEMFLWVLFWVLEIRESNLCGMYH